MGDLRFDGRVVIVTGAGGGIGREHALLFASRGASVVVNDLGGSVGGEGSDGGPAERLVADIRASGGIAVADGHSVATPEGGRAIVETALDAFGRVDVVVNNAGILRDKAFHNLTSELLDALLDVHLKGAMHVTQPAWIRFREQGYGRVINTSSNSGILGNFGQANYSAAKMGLVGLTKVLAIEGAKHGIKSNAIAPMALTRMLSDMDLGRMAQALDPALVSPLAAFLAHEDCPVSGEVFSVGAGRVSRFFIASTPGYYNSNLKAEDVRDHFPQICDEAGYVVHSGVQQEFASLLNLISTVG
jgi:NAD(P)-dependent dehydrogenase (short-subunit alcohol dehydrogenase family)